jgi:ABC-type transport system involved in cytochrome c biogenesis permease subunit
VKNSKPELTTTELPLTNELNLAWSSEINDKKQADTSSQLSATLDNLSYRILSLGFPLLTIGILSGQFGQTKLGVLIELGPERDLGIYLVCVAIYLHTRISKGWTGQRSAFIASFGFIIIGSVI